MANIKFSQFTVGNTESDIDFVVGYKGGDNIQISPANLLSATLTGYLPLTGGTMSGNVKFNDNVELRLGSGADLKAYHSGTHTYFDNNVGDLVFRNLANDKDIVFQSDDGSGGVTTYFLLDGSATQTKFEKNTKHIDGVEGRFGNSNDLILKHSSGNSFIENYTGNLSIRQFADDQDIQFLCDDGSGGTTEYFRVDGGAEIVVASKEFRFGDNVPIKLGTGPDFQMLHNGTTTSFENSTGNLLITNFADDSDIIFKSDDGSGGVTEYFKLDGGLVNGTSTLGAINFPDKSKIFMGTGNDLRIYHNGTDSALENVTGDLYIQNYADDKDIVFQSDDGAGGVTDYLRIDGSNTNVKFSKDLYLLDNVKARIGTGSDLQISHDAADSYIQNFTGNLKIFQNANDKDITFYNDDGSGGTTAYFFLDGSLELNRFLKSTLYNDNIRASFGASSDLQIYHDGTDSYLSNNTGSLYIRQNADDSDIVFQSDDGSGGLTEYFRLDGSSSLTIFTKNLRMIDTAQIQLGGGSDLRLRHNGTDSYIENFNGDFYIDQNTADKDIVFRNDNGSGGVTTYFYLDGSLILNRFLTHTLYNDNIEARFGTQSDLTIYHDGSNSYIKDSGTGNLEIRSNFLKVKSPTAEDMIWAQENAGITLFHNNVAKLATTSTGVRITGVSEYADNTAAIAGGLTTGDVYRTGDLLKIVH